MTAGSIAQQAADWLVKEVKAGTFFGEFSADDLCGHVSLLDGADETTRRSFFQRLPSSEKDPLFRQHFTATHSPNKARGRIYRVTKPEATEVQIARFFKSIAESPGEFCCQTSCQVSELRRKSSSLGKWEPKELTTKTASSNSNGLCL